MLHLLVSLLALEGAHAAITLVQPAATSIPSKSLPSFSLPSLSLPSGVSFPLPSLSIPTPSLSLPSGVSFSLPSLSIPTSRPSISATEVFTVSVGGVASADGATTYALEEIFGVDGSTTTIGYTFAQGATVWRQDDRHETCSLDGHGKAVCSIGVAGFETGFTGTAFPLVTVGSDGQIQGGGPGLPNPTATAPRSGDGGSGSSGGGAGGGAIGLDARASLGWGVVVSLGAAVAAMRVLF
ncbi:hypothetical protein FB45DRAFT_242567 [Roridomyces roridus]|uniref:Uncharacterized protein n=1 Tax=Roridomyces roridus TaxID=1738132 RepID=A0AAD7BA09_9AGAR|nr:hypothetical protein FB45DRAFT_242567 [Roridomyces roridus]